MFKKLGQLKDLWNLKNQIQEIKKRLDNMVIKVDSPNHVFEVTVSGSQEVKEVKVNDNIKSFSQEQLGEELKTVINKAVRDSQALAAQAMGSMAGDLPNA